MTEAVEVAIELALLTRAQAFAVSKSLGIALPNIPFDAPTVGRNAKYLRASMLPADTNSLGVSHASTDQHYGYLQMDVFFGAGGGEIEPKRIASDIVSYFIRGTKMIKDSFIVEVLRTPSIGPQLEIDDAWTSIPVRIPYTCFAIPA